jgi:hypothetical protein
MSSIINIDLVKFTGGEHSGQHAVLADGLGHHQLLTLQGGTIKDWCDEDLELGDRQDLWLRRNTRAFVDIDPKNEPAVKAIAERLEAAGQRVVVGAKQPLEHGKLIDALVGGRLESMTLHRRYPGWYSVYFKAVGCHDELCIRFTEVLARGLVELFQRGPAKASDGGFVFPPRPEGEDLSAEEFLREMRESLAGCHGNRLPTPRPWPRRPGEPRRLIRARRRGGSETG